jgi:hypothetical protein
MGSNTSRFSSFYFNLLPPLRDHAVIINACICGRLTEALSHARRRFDHRDMMAAQRQEQGEPPSATSDVEYRRGWVDLPHQTVDFNIVRPA